jgi:hypothetical protein
MMASWAKLVSAVMSSNSPCSRRVASLAFSARSTALRESPVAVMRLTEPSSSRKRVSARTRPESVAVEAIDP